ncbi:MAG TPA: 3-dehydroquinate synthase [Bryobacteraceae bacterium]|nr:3-dehydroquinate synthase [Bryobacteraceae bacterium]
MPTFQVQTGRENYPCVVERGVLSDIAKYLPPRAGKIFVATTADVWELYGPRVTKGLAAREFHTLIFPGGESTKKFAHVEALAEQMVEAGADRSSVIIACGGGIVNDMGGFLASIFMRGVPVIQIPTTLLAQVDAAIGGKTGVNLKSGKNLIGAFHQPLAVLIDPDALRSLPEREFRAGLFEVVKYGVISSPELFELLEKRSSDVLAQNPDVLDRIIAESVRIKAEVVTADEKESDLRRILNFGHTVGHALEAETEYQRFLHGEAVAFGMNAATELASFVGLLASPAREAILRTVSLYGPIPSLQGIQAESLLRRLISDKKTIQGKIHFVLPERIGKVRVLSGVPEDKVFRAIQAALA